MEILVVVAIVVVVIWWLSQREKQGTAPSEPTSETVESESPPPAPHVPVTSSGETIAADIFGRSDEINAGKEGTIFEIPQHRLIDVEGRMLFKRLSESSPQVRVQFDALRAFLDARPPEARDHLLRSTAWPLQLTQDGGVPNGFVMRRATDEFRVSITGPKGRRKMLAEMPYLASDDSYLTRLEVLPLPTVDDRVAVLAELAELLAILHEGGAVYGDLSLVNTVYSVEPAGVFLLDCDSIRVPGSPATLNQLHASDYIPPRPEDPATSATDVYKFACLTQDVLAQPLHAPTVVDKPARATERMPGPLGELLLRRSLAPEPADRPSMRDWADFLSSAGLPAPAPKPEPGFDPPLPPPDPVQPAGDDPGWVFDQVSGEWRKAGPSRSAQPRADHEPETPAATSGWVRDSVTGEWRRKRPDD